jgi:NADH-quinone oxidoreductase subunit L
MYLSLLILFPLLGFILGNVFSRKKEEQLSLTVLITTVANLIVFLVVLFQWLQGGRTSIVHNVLYLYQSEHYNFIISLYFNQLSAVYTFVGTLLMTLIARYSRFYMHRENGYKRFFNTISFFYLGYNLIVLAGNFETLFVGWEIIGMASFLLISFYRERYLPVRNALKVFSIYRIGDIGILLTMWANHQLWHKNISFVEFENTTLVSEVVRSHTGIGIFISCLIFLAASVKSAQLPFSSWLPRAMEGPTPSSAIFYGSLSVHFGVFLLLRTSAFWDNFIWVKGLIILFGVLTAIIANQISKVQSTIKTQIAYASVSQIGIMFIEVALGLETLALIHFAGNAFLRTYQLLASPSVVSYLIRDKFYRFKPVSDIKKTGKLFLTLYSLNIKEWGLDQLISHLIFNPAKKLGKALGILSILQCYALIVISICLATIILFLPLFISTNIKWILVYFFSGFALLLLFRSFVERYNVFFAWNLVASSQVLVAFALAINEIEHYRLHVIIFLSGIILSWSIGLVLLKQVQKISAEGFNLNDYNGLSYEFPAVATRFFLCALGIIGFPITTAFLGLDLLLGHIHHNQFILALIAALSFIFSGIVVFRIYSRLFLGPHYGTSHPVAYKLS